MPASPSRRALLLTASASLAGAALGGSRALAAGADPFQVLEASMQARIGVAGLDTGTGQRVGHRADERFPFCSTFKVVAASAILKRSAAEPGLLDRRITFEKEDVVTYSPVTSRHLEDGMTVAEICAAALQYSDNTAGNLMIRLLGGTGAVTAFARSIGDRQFRLDRPETALNEALPGDPRDTTTPAAMLDDLHRLALGDLLGPPQQLRLGQWMKGCTTGANRIRGVAPAGWAVGNKTGSGDYGIANDIAVLWPPGERAPVVLAIYTTRTNKDDPAHDEVVAAAAKIALDMLKAGG